MELSFSEFAAKVYELSPGEVKNPVKEGYWTRWKPVKSVSEITKNSRLQGERVHTGGVTGGSCFDSGDSDPHHAYTSEYEEPEIEGLDKLLTELCPQITFLQYKRLKKEANIQTKTEQENDYYGNHSDYVFKFVRLEDLYNAMCLIGIL